MAEHQQLEEEGRKGFEGSSQKKEQASLITPIKANHCYLQQERQEGQQEQALQQRKHNSWLSRDRDRDGGGKVTPQNPAATRAISWVEHRSE